jgi:hypothetical protein
MRGRNLRRRGRRRSDRRRPRSGRELAHAHLLLRDLLLNVGRTGLEPPFFIMSPTLAPAPLWRPVALPFPVRIPCPMATGIVLVQPLPPRPLASARLVIVEVLKGPFAAHSRIPTAAIHRRRWRLAKEVRGDLDLDLRRQDTTSDRGAGKATLGSRVPTHTHSHLSTSPLRERETWATGLGGVGPKTT